MTLVYPRKTNELEVTLLNPSEDSAVYYGMNFVSEWGYKPVTMIACAAIATVAAFVPQHWTVRLIDETVMSIDWDEVGPIVGLTGTVFQARRMRELAEEARVRGKLVIIGGSFASLSPEEVQPWCDVLCVGEMEEVAEKLFADIEAGTWQTRYSGTRTDLSKSPMPRWDLYPNQSALIGLVQTSRGCPFECEFCDVIAYLGRKQRHKSEAQVTAELEQLWKLGYRSVFLADDNLTVYRRRAMSLLAANRDWNQTHSDEPLMFGTQVSVDVARDEALLKLLSDAGVAEVFVGIETPNEASLLSVKKRQNVGVDLTGVLETFVRHRITVGCGIIIGFDTDESDIFEKQAAFIADLPVPFLSIAPLTAPPQTPFYMRLEREGHLVPEGTATALNAFTTNIIPARMTRDHLLEGVRNLVKVVYDIDAFMHRVRRFIAVWSSENAPAPHKNRQSNVLSAFQIQLLNHLRRLGSREFVAMRGIVDIVEFRPWLLQPITGF